MHGSGFIASRRHGNMRFFAFFYCRVHFWERGDVTVHENWRTGVAEQLTMDMWTLFFRDCERSLFMDWRLSRVWFQSCIQLELASQLEPVSLDLRISATSGIQIRFFSPPLFDSMQMTERTRRIQTMRIQYFNSVSFFPPTTFLTISCLKGKKTTSQ